jgi:DNA-binding HxlR family transcriptional regulator
MADAEVEIAADLPDLRPLARLCARRWSVPAIADLYRLRGAKFVTLANRLGVSRESLSRTLSDLQALDLVMRNPGYGHPMRPEYLLTPDGESVGPAALAVVKATPEDAREACSRKWALPGLAALSAGLDRFSDLAAALEGVTPRALTMTLEGLEDAGLVVRSLDDDRAARPRYEPAAGAEALGDAARRLADAIAFEA